MLYVYTIYADVNPRSLPPHSRETYWRTPCHQNRAYRHPPPRNRNSTGIRQDTQAIWQRLVEDGFDLSYDTFHSTLWRVQRRPRITAATRRKTAEVSERAAEQLTEEPGHDPLANLRKVERSRPGFHYRATENLDVLVHGKRESREQSKR